MSRNSRRKRLKNASKKHSARVKADEVFNYGSMSIARYGKYIEFSNNSTPEEHAAMLERTKVVYKETLAKLEVEVVALQVLVKKYDPVMLMHRAAYMMLPLFMKYRSENEYSAEENYSLPTVEYIQYLIARSPVAESGGEPTEDEWNELWQQALKL